LDSILKKDMNGNLGEILRSIAAGERVENYGKLITINEIKFLI